jgi:hypothetical protein
MTPQEMEWNCEQIETRYLRGKIGPIAFHRQMSRLGFSTDGIKRHRAELDEQRAQQGKIQ